MLVKNSSGKEIGAIEILQEEIIIKHYLKPILVIDNKIHVAKILEKDEAMIKILYDDYTLVIGEIAALYGCSYPTITKRLKQQKPTSGQKSGRRNSSFGKTFSDERKENISKSLTGRKLTFIYERTPEIKEKISKGLKNYFNENKVSEDTRKKLSEAWQRGCYKSVKMGRGIQGYFYSLKNKEEFYFRSLLELQYCLILEQDNNVDYYSVEPFTIPLENNHRYTPDFFINGEHIIELKSYKHLNYESEERFNLEQKYAKEYSKKHNYSFNVIYDIDLNFETAKFKRFLKNNLDLVEKYKIKFSNSDIKTWS